MASSSSSVPDDQDRPAVISRGLRAFIEGIPEPGLILVPGGRIAAANRAVARLSSLPMSGMTIVELLGRCDMRRADGGDPLVRGEFPHDRALRGEYVTEGERFDVTLPDGSLCRALATSIPIIAEGTVVAALSVWHDLAESQCGPTERPDPGDAGLAPDEE